MSRRARTDTDGSTISQSFRNLLHGGVGSLALSYNLQLFAECVLLRGKRHELFMPETHALRLGERSHGVHYGNFAFCDFVDPRTSRMISDIFSQVSG